MRLSIAAAVALALCFGLVPNAASAGPPPRPKLIVAISVDQFSANLFDEYRRYFTAGLKRLQDGAVFPSGYQSHAATETCPGHATILTGARPARSGVIANGWVDQSLAREDKTVYCAEDPTVPGSASNRYQVSAALLRVPTLGDRLKAAAPGSRNVAVAGKDRAAAMMGGHQVDQLWWSSGRGFTTPEGRPGPPPAAVAEAGARTAAMIDREAPANLPANCVSKSVPVQLQRSDRIVGVLTARAAGDTTLFRATGEYDVAVADLAIGMMNELRLGRGPATDVLSIGLSATDYVGHRYGAGGAEMCANMMALDATVGRILSALDATGVPYVVVLTADHGGADVPERSQAHGVLDAARLDPALTLGALNTALQQQFGLSAPPLLGDGLLGDLYVSRTLAPDLRARVQAAARARLLAHPQVEAVFTRDEIARLPSPRPPVDHWTLAERFRASFNIDRSGDLLLSFKQNVTPIATPSGNSSSATHGSPWVYDRRVPILFYWPGATGFEQPMSIETVDILPTLAALIGLSVPPAEIDGRCIDLDAGPASTCPL